MGTTSEATIKDAADGLADKMVSTGFGPHQQLSHRVATYVREGIMIGHFQADQYLRTETLAADLKTSATPVREALMILQSEGSVRWEPRRGFRVVSVSDDDIRDQFQVQAYIAGELAARAARVLDAAAVAELRALQESLATAADRGDAEAVDKANHEIHRRINKAANSPRMTALLNQTVHYVPLGFFGTIKGWSEASAHDHSAIFDAIEWRNAEAARMAMSHHIMHIGDLLVAHLQMRRGE
ncbi:MAG TPA: GntR family transcriptional regulator [Amycolatopsis sp.]|nr:GntR family transcriptional regulator [Amycolatopsis sp.]